MDLAMIATPKLISSELLVLILLVPQCITTDLIDFGSTILLMHHKTFSIWSLPIPRSSIDIWYLSIQLNSVWDQLGLSHQSPQRKHRILTGDSVSSYVTETEMTVHIGFLNLCTACASVPFKLGLFFISRTRDKNKTRNEKELVWNK